jgi:ATP/maltotriose-dependent transcriptional regulator MalT
LVLGRANLVRERLLDRRAARWSAPITVVSAPAGYGKTTVLRQAAAANAARPAGVDLWFRCMPRHTALSSFGEALCRAVEAPEPSLSQTHVDVDDLVASVVEAVTPRRAPGPGASSTTSRRAAPDAGRICPLDR